MHPPMLATFPEISHRVVAMCSAGILLFLIALWAARTDIARARGLDKIAAMSNLGFAIPCWPRSLSMATKIQVRWSGLRFGIMMFLFVAMLIIPGVLAHPLLVSYLTGAILLVAGVSILPAKKTRMAATYLGTWIVLLVWFIYGPILISSMSEPSPEVKVEGINYFADTLLFAGAIRALASATPGTD